MARRRGAVVSQSHDDIASGMVISAMLHAAIFALAWFGLPHFLTPPKDVEEPIVVDIAEIAEKTTPPPPQVEEPKPEEKPPEPPKAEEPKPEPVPEPPV